MNFGTQHATSWLFLLFVISDCGPAVDGPADLGVNCHIEEVPGGHISPISLGDLRGIKILDDTFGYDRVLIGNPVVRLHLIHLRLIECCVRQRYVSIDYDYAFCGGLDLFFLSDFFSINILTRMDAG